MTKITIHNFRSGFATNSSSSHSIILLRPADIGNVTPIDEYSGDYGWGFFRLVSEEAKLRYICAQFFSNMHVETYGKPEDEAARIEAAADIERDKVVAHFEKVSPGFSDTFDRSGYVDHQSVFSGLKFTPEAADQLIEFFKSPRVVVLGGNDNSDEDDHVNAVEGSQKVEFIQQLMRDSGSDKIALRIDGKYWSVFDRTEGTKVRVSFDETDYGCEAYTKAKAPELVDLKITNYCAGGCNFCYQSSTKAGQHASYDDIMRHVSLLSELEVFEIAIGGGEPTDHPDFARILTDIRATWIVPNFTTFSDRWLENTAIVDAVCRYVGGIGVSCHDAKGLKLVKTIATALDDYSKDNKVWRYPGVRIMAQHVVGSVPLNVTAEFIKACIEQDVDILLLGYKTVGFGKDYQRFDNGDVETYLKMALDHRTLNTRRGVSVSVDTALVDRFPNLLKMLNVPEALVTSPEGKFSCYIDAVTDTMGMSSYVEPSEMVKAPTTADDFKKVFATY